MRRKKRLRKILLALLPPALLGIAAAVLFLLPLSSISFEGNNYYSDAEMEEYIFGSPGRHSALGSRIRLRTTQTAIPFVEKYTYVFDGLRSVRFTVYEKTLAGYLSFQGYYLYFDWDGTVVESSDRQLVDVLEITGLEIDYAVLGDVLPVKDKSIFSYILQITQYLYSRTVEWNGGETTLGDLADEIHFSGSSMSVIFGDITVVLGDSEYFEEKLMLMAAMLPELEGKSGTLYLDSYTEGTAHSSYIFKEN